VCVYIHTIYTRERRERASESESEREKMDRKTYQGKQPFVLMRIFSDAPANHPKGTGKEEGVICFRESDCK
jgi:hypothetical protein